MSFQSLYSRISAGIGLALAGGLIWDNQGNGSAAFPALIGLLMALLILHLFVAVAGPGVVARRRLAAHDLPVVPTIGRGARRALKARAAHAAITAKAERSERPGSDAGRAAAASKASRGQANGAPTPGAGSAKAAASHAHSAAAQCTANGPDGLQCIGTAPIGSPYCSKHEDAKIRAGTHTPAPAPAPAPHTPPPPQAAPTPSPVAPAPQHGVVKVAPSKPAIRRAKVQVERPPPQPRVTAHKRPVKAAAKGGRVACAAITARATPCQNAARPAQTYCGIHAKSNAAAAKASPADGKAKRGAKAKGSAATSRTKASKKA